MGWLATYVTHNEHSTTNMFINYSEFNFSFCFIKPLFSIDSGRKKHLYIDICIIVWARLIFQVMLIQSLFLSSRYQVYFPEGDKVFYKYNDTYYAQAVSVHIVHIVFLCSQSWIFLVSFHLLKTCRYTDWPMSVNSCGIRNSAQWCSGVSSRVACTSSETLVRIKLLSKMNDRMNHIFISESVLMAVSSLGNCVTNLMSTQYSM